MFEVMSAYVQKRSLVRCPENLSCNRHGNIMRSVAVREKVFLCYA
jgi:hypothetical protein